MRLVITAEGCRFGNAGMEQYKLRSWHCRGDELQQREEALRAQLEELTSIQTRAVQALQDASAAASSAPAAASPGQAAAPAAAANPVTQSAAAAASAAAGPSAQPEAQAGPSIAGNATTAGSGIRSPPQPALFRTPAAPPTGDAARGIAQVLEGSARTGRITSAMFGSAIQAALAAATQVRLATNACCAPSSCALSQLALEQ